MTESILIILKSYRYNSQSTGRIKIFCFCIFWWTIFWRSSASDGLQSLKSLASEYASERESWIASEDLLMFFRASSIASLLHCSLNFYLMILHTRTIISNTNCYFNILLSSKPIIHWENAVRPTLFQQISPQFFVVISFILCLIYLG
jgi:hypothetical protein